MTTGTRKALADPARLEALRETRLLDQPSHRVLDGYLDLVEMALGTPVALVSLVDNERQFFTSSRGLGSLTAERRQTPLSHSFCQHVVTSRSALIVSDGRNEPKLKHNGAIRDMGVIAYAGFPITTADGQVLGSLCAIDSEPHQWEERELNVLSRLAELAAQFMDLRRRATRAEASEKQATQLHQRLAEQSTSSRELARSATHDIRASLNALNLSAELLLHHEALTDFPELTRLARTMQRNAQYASQLTREIGERATLSTEVVNITGVVFELVSDAQQHTEHKLQCSADPDQIRLVPMNELALRRCLMNLISNAIRFARERIEVSLHTEENYCVISVQDDGHGLPNDAAYSGVWEHGQRYHTDTGQSGSGLGLHIVRDLVINCGGSVQAQPSELGGACFSMRLPLLAEPARENLQ